MLFYLLCSPFYWRFVQLGGDDRSHFTGNFTGIHSRAA
jgi:hypothetical protein